MTKAQILVNIQERIDYLKSVEDDYKNERRAVEKLMAEARRHELEGLLDEIEMWDMVEDINNSNMEEHNG